MLDKRGTFLLLDGFYCKLSVGVPIGMTQIDTGRGPLPDGMVQFDYVLANLFLHVWRDENNYQQN